jgi:transcriptional regulator with XRE-family HTH domain
MNKTQTSVNHRQIGYRIKEVREQNRLSQAQLAEITDLSVSYISHIENAKRKASLESIIRIVNALGITVDELLAGVQINNPAAYQTDIDILMEDCSENEKRFVYELIKISLETMHKNGWELASKDMCR